MGPALWDQLGPCGDLEHVRKQGPAIKQLPEGNRLGPYTKAARKL